MFLNGYVKKAAPKIEFESRVWDGGERICDCCTKSFPNWNPWACQVSEMIHDNKRVGPSTKLAGRQSMEAW